MSLRIRRGSDTSRQSTAFDTGELVWTTDTNKLFVGGVVGNSNLGGINILASSAGTGLTWDATSQTIQFGGLGAYSTDNLPEGVSPSKLYFTTARAKDAAAAMLTATGTAPVSGTVTATNTNGTVTLGASITTGSINQGEKFVLSGAGLPARGLTASIYYVISASGTSVVLASTLANALASIAITSITSTGSVSSVNYNAGQINGIAFTYDSTNKVMSASISIQGDTTPTLGGNLVLNGNNITGTGNITTSGTFYATSGLGGNLVLNGNSITGTGNISTTGGITLSPTDSLVSFNILGTTTTTDTTANIALKSSRASTTAVVNGDLLGQYVISGYNGTSYIKSLVLNSTISGTIQGNGAFNSDAGLYVSVSDGTYRVFTFKSTGAFGTVAVGFTPINTTGRNSQTPTDGNLIYNTDVGALQLYVGSSFQTMPNIVSAPSTATSTGKVGQIAFDNSYFYVCTASNVWKRATISSW